MNFSLLEEAWIPVLFADGRSCRVGLRDALLMSNRIRQLAGSNPMDRAAMLRFLLAALYWCKGNPPPDAAAQCANGIPAEWLNKLEEEEYRECFNLLGDGKRFLQYCVAGGKETLLPANYLIQEVPTGSNINLFRHATDKYDGLCRACCALGLLRLPMFATSAGRGKPPGVNSKPPVYAIPMGRSLAETLLLNWRPHDNLGEPAWEHPACSLPAAGSVSLLAGLTWVPRRVWLEQPDLPEAACVSCGARGRLIRRTVYAPIGSTKTAEDSPRREWSDPHVIYSDLKNGIRASFHARDALGNADAAADQWQRILTGLLGSWAAHQMDSTGSYPPMESSWLMGFATVQNDKYLEAMEWSLPAPVAREHLQAALDTATQWQKGQSKFSGRVQKELSASSSRKSVEVPAILANVKPQAEQILYAQVRQLAAARPAAWKEAALEAYAPLMQAAAESLVPGASVMALAKRRRLAALAPAPVQSPPAKPGKGEMKIKIKPEMGGQP